VLVVAGCGGSTSEPASRTTPDVEVVDEATAEPSSPTTPYTVDLEVEVLDEATVRVDGTTNLPDNSLITVVGSRVFRFESESDMRATNVADEEVTVSDGSFSTTLSLDESNLLIGLDLDPIGVISSDVDVCAEFRTGEDIVNGEQRQPDAGVVATVGTYGEALRDSPQVKVFGSATDNPANWLEVHVTVPLSSPLLSEIASGQGNQPDEERLDGFCTS
jgi:hypothetical protein